MIEVLELHARPIAYLFTFKAETAPPGLPLLMGRFYSIEEMNRLDKASVLPSSLEALDNTESGQQKQRKGVLKSN